MLDTSARSIYDRLRCSPGHLFSVLPARSRFSSLWYKASDASFLGTLTRRMSTRNGRKSTDSDESLAENPNVTKCGFDQLVQWRRSRRARGVFMRLLIAMRRYEASKSSEEDCVDNRPATRNAIRLRDGNALLDAMEIACHTLRTVQADRSYRDTFTSSYRVLFFGENVRWLYRLDLLYAAQNRIGAIWVNGVRYAFSEEVLEAGEELAQKWTQLSEWMCKLTECTSIKTKVFIDTMAELDRAWVRFEEGYISRLIFIEAHAKRIISDAVLLEGKLFSSLDPDPGIRRELVESINLLNSLGNQEGKGRSDLPVEILECVNDTNLSSELYCLAEDIRKSFTDVCTYLRSIALSLDMVDPHLPNNAELVRLLQRWEETWEIGKKYILDGRLRASLVSLLRHIKSVCLDGMDVFREKLHVFDVDALWAVATIVVLQFLSSPKSDLLCREFLPECWEDDDSLEALATSYSYLPDDSYRQLYLCIIGRGEPDENIAPFWSELNNVATDLQRRHPVDWNLFVMVLTRCLIAQSESAVTSP